MADPTKYIPGYSYSGYQASNPTKPLPAPQVDNDFANIATSIDETIDALADVRRSDGALKNGIVTADSLSPDLLLGIRKPTAWEPDIDYAETDTVFVVSGAEPGIYRCLVDHTSSADFYDDLADDKWEIIFSLTLAGAMPTAIYDPQGIEADVFDRANHTGPNVLDDSSVTNAKVASNAAIAATKLAYDKSGGGVASSTVQGALAEIERRSFDNLIQSLLEVRTELDRVVPYCLTFEMWQMTSFAGWVDRGTGLQAKVTEAHVRAIVTQWKRMGYKMIMPLYVEIFGNWFTRPNFTKWYDYDQNVNGTDWMLSNPTYNDDFDVLAVIIDQARIDGLLVAIDIGRVGLGRLMADLQAGTSSYGALTFAQEKDLATARTRQLIADLIVRFGSMPHVVGLGIGFEPSYMTSFAPWAATVTTAATTGIYPYEHPALGAYGKQLICTPAILADLPASGASQATKETFAALLRQTGFHVFAAQFGAGNGIDYTTFNATYQSSKTIATAAQYFARFDEVAHIANSSGGNFGRAIEMGVKPEGWDMGDTPSGITVSLSATSGSSITATFSSPLPAGVNAAQGRWFAAGGGIARIVNATGLPNSIVIDTTAVVGSYTGRNFSSTSISANSSDGSVENWSLLGNTAGEQYTNGKPSNPNVQLGQFNIAGRYSSLLFHMSGPPYMVIDDLPLALPQNAALQTDFRTQANAMGSWLQAYNAASKLRLQEGRNRLGVPIAKPDVFPGALNVATPPSVNTTGTTYVWTANSLWDHNSVFAYSKLRISVTVNMNRIVSLNDPGILETMRMTINGVEVGNSSVFSYKAGAFGIGPTLTFEYDGQGQDITIGLRVTYDGNCGHPTLTSAMCVVTEI